jgi:hypothetical protein
MKQRNAAQVGVVSGSIAQKMLVLVEEINRQ